ncbi:hypothetical protein B9Z55_025735 [Caenorhabditis nigoni]|uniref:G-protein coupled receptors family 1 profile domain-containing protein n=1 Tax=Caenorhabditis nigoni TaxID=1611254 RepID=A0A2G5T042_9PELO|nr:hypothetical protein B9Z55_025735 [Caenorhabditis nigoni]
MDKFFSVNGFTFSTMTSFSLTLLASLFPVLCIFFNAVLLTVARMNRNCNTFPLAYVVVMGINGIIISIFVWFHCVTFLVLSESYYSAYLVWFGKETTFFATLSYLNYLLVCVLMTVNRIFAVAFPFRDIFTNFRIYVLSVLICIVTFVSLAIPYFSPCYIVFNTRKLSFVSGCAPDRHPLSLLAAKRKDDASSYKGMKRVAMLRLAGHPDISPRKFTADVLFGKLCDSKCGRMV